MIPSCLFAQAPGLSSITPSSGMQGATIAVSLMGSGFVDGTTRLSVAGGLLVVKMRVLDSTHINALLVLDAPPGPQSIAVSTPNGVSNALEFDVQPSALDSATSFHIDPIAGRTPGSVDGIGQKAGFLHPNYIWGDSANLYVSENQVVRKIDLATARVTTLAGVPGVAGFVDGVGDQARFSLVEGIWSDGTSVYVLDAGNEAVRKIDVQTRAVTTIAQGLRADKTEGEFGDDLWGNGPYLYVTQMNPRLLLRVEIATGNVTTFAGSGSMSLTDGVGTAAAFWFPHAISGDSTNLYLLDATSLREVAIATAKVTSIANTVPNSAVWQNDVAFYFTSGTGVWRMDRSSGVTTLIAGDQYTLGAADGNGTAARFQLAKGIWGNQQYLYVADWGNNAIRKIALATGDVTTFAGSITDRSIINGDRSTARFGNIRFVASDGLNLYVSDSGSVASPQLALRKMSFASGEFISLATMQLGPLWSDGEFLYYSTSGCTGGGEIRKLRIANGEVTVLAGKLGSGDLNPVDGPPATARFPYPSAVWGNGDSLFVADMILATCSGGPSCLFPRPVKAVIRQISLASGLVTTLSTDPLDNYSGPQIWGDGEYLYRSSFTLIDRISIETGAVTTITATSGGIAPAGIWGDGTNLYVADNIHQMVNRVDLATGSVSTIASAATGLLQYPSQIWSDGAHLYVANSSMIQEISGDGFQPRPASSSPFVVVNRGGTAINTAAPAALSVGYAKIQANDGLVNPSGVALFQYRPAGVTVTEAAVPASPLIQSGRIYAEVSGPVNTGIAIAKPDSQPATLSFVFTDASGVTFGSGTATIPANGQIAQFLNQAPFSPGASIQNARTFTFTSSVPVSAIALRGYTNERSEFLITTLPVAPLGAGNSQPLYFAHFASGGGWTTNLVLVNPTDAALTGTIRFTGSRPYDPLRYTIPPRSATAVQLAIGGQTVNTGWIEVMSDSISTAPSGLVIFSFKSNSITVSETGVPSVALSQRFQTYVENSGAFGSPSSLQSGLAIANPSQSDIMVTLELFTLNGQPFGDRDTLTVPASSEIPIFLNQIPAFNNLTSGFEGIVRISTDSAQAMSVIGLRAHYNERGDFLVATMPAIPAENVASSDAMLFPQIAAGGGYTTKLILFSGTDAQQSSGSVQFFSQSGQELDAITSNGIALASMPHNIP
jgi:hypothetical protein